MAPSRFQRLCIRIAGLRRLSGGNYKIMESKEFKVKEEIKDWDTETKEGLLVIKLPSDPVMNKIIRGILENLF